MFFYWVVFPVAIITGAWWLFSKSPNKLLKAGSVLIGLLLFSGYLWLLVGQKWLIDQKIIALCKEDGGIEVYEKTLIPKKYVDRHGRIKIPDRANAKPYDPYFYETKKYYYRKGNPVVSRREYRIVRREDNKILGRLVIYGRGGGGLPGPWHESSFTCPKQSELPNFESQVFIVGD